MDVSDAQENMRNAYLNGAPGVFLSGCTWLVAAGVASARPPLEAMAVFVVLGMAIHPLASALSRWLGRAGRASADNPLNWLALESTALLLLGLFLAYTVSLFSASLFFSTMLVVVGARYGTFHTLYGIRTYWVLAGVLACAGVALTIMTVPSWWGAAIGGVTEIVMAGVLSRRPSR